MGVLLITLFCLFSVFKAQFIDPEYNYDDFMRQFQRNYIGNERQQHEKIFKQNYASIIEMKKQGLDVQVNNFTDWNQTQLKEFFNYHPSQLGLQASPLPLKSSLASSVPPSLDWRALGRVTDIKNQGSCGSCWSFSTTALYESLLAILTNGTKYNLAQQYGLQCQNIRSSGCKGGIPIHALKLFNQTGIPLESAYLYKGNDTYYQSIGRPICTSTNRIKLSKPIKRIIHYQNMTISQIEQALHQYGPISVGVYSAHNGFMYIGSSGVVSCPSGVNRSQIDHAILLVGYNSSHWFIKNSWGTNWGHNGFGYISKTNDCGLKFYVDLAQVDFGFNPTNTTNTNTNANKTVVNLSISLIDSKSDGWNGNVIAIKQNNIIKQFGGNFTSGSSLGPINISVDSDSQVVVFAKQKGSKTSQVGFTIKLPNGTTIYERKPGQQFAVNSVFTIFCPTSNCVVSSTVDYYLTLTDSYGDGWDGNVLAFRQGTRLQKFTLNNGRQSDPTKFTFMRNTKTEIIVDTMGTWSEEIGYQLRTFDGIIVASRAPGTKFYANNILSSFCPDCILSKTLQSPTQSQNQGSDDKMKEIVNQRDRNNIKQRRVSKALIIGLGVFSSLSIAVIILLAVFLIKSRRELTKLRQTLPIQKSPSYPTYNQNYKYKNQNQSNQTNQKIVTRSINAVANNFRRQQEIIQEGTLAE